jgi:hypothetical protein
VSPIATQTDTQRRIAAQKAAATRQENAAKRSRSAKKAAETRAKGRLSAAKKVGLQAQRAVDTAVGTAISAGENVAEAVRPVRSRSGAQRELRHLRDKASGQVTKVERRGAQARKKAQRELTRRRKRLARSAVDEGPLPDSLRPVVDPTAKK